MGDEFLEHDLDTPTEADLDAAYGSQTLGVTDVGTKKIRTKIVKVGKKDVRDRDNGQMKKRILVFFENIDKPLILNVTNKNVLVEALGKAPAGWLNASVGILVDPTVGFGGKKTGGVRLRVLGPAVAAKSTPNPAPAVAKPATKPPEAAAPWADEAGDPGADFNDMVPDLSAG